MTPPFNPQEYVASKIAALKKERSDQIGYLLELDITAALLEGMEKAREVTTESCGRVCRAHGDYRDACIRQDIRRVAQELAVKYGTSSGARHFAEELFALPSLNPPPAEGKEFPPADLERKQHGLYCEPCGQHHAGRCSKFTEEDIKDPDWEKER